MINIITRKSVGDELFELITLDAMYISHEEYRKGSSFFRREIYEINPQRFPNIPPELHGFWQSNMFTYDANDVSKEDVIELRRVEKITKTIEVHSWVEIE